MLKNTEQNIDLTRVYTVSTFVYWQGSILLHLHKKLGVWLPPGGKIEANELPETAAVRECLEETGILIRLLGDTALQQKDLAPDSPRQLLRPRGLQLETISANKEHIDFIYFALPDDKGYDGSIASTYNAFAWYTPTAWQGLPLTVEVQKWLELCYYEISQNLHNQSQTTY